MKNIMAPYGQHIHYKRKREQTEKSVHEHKQVLYHRCHGHRKDDEDRLETPDRGLSAQRGVETDIRRIVETQEEHGCHIYKQEFESYTRDVYT